MNATVILEPLKENDDIEKYKAIYKEIQNEINTLHNSEDIDQMTYDMFLNDVLQVNDENYIKAIRSNLSGPKDLMQTNSVIIMFHTRSGVARAHNTRSGLHTFFGLVQHRKQTLRRAIILGIVAAVFILVGSILTWLAFRDIFGNKVAGPVFLGLAFLLILLAIQRFVQAKKHIAQSRNEQQTVGVVLEEDNGEGGAITVIMDSLQFRNAWRDPDQEESVPPPSYTEATDTSCIEPPVVVPVVSPDENEAPPCYEEAIEDSQHSISDVEMSERQPG
ncbi:unnamed protein product [Mytilus coruscus]|uniref:Uncharacterized protein n=1 Tax=Mytilus coruscus TaxID=42192 RepID=A0A6J8D2C7_MYTCO|nr:unnamed protein product [Mytilus coruscus]